MSIPILSVYKFRGRNRSLSWLKSSSESCASVAHSLDVLREILEVPWLEWLEAIILILVDAQVVYIIELAAMEQVMEHVKEQKMNNLMSFNHGGCGFGHGHPLSHVTDEGIMPLCLCYDKSLLNVPSQPAISAVHCKSHNEHPRSHIKWVTLAWPSLKCLTDTIIVLWVLWLFRLIECGTSRRLHHWALCLE